MSDDLINRESIPERCPLPEGSMINAELTITSYFDLDGKLKYAVHLNGNINLAQAIGLLELSKGSVVEFYERTAEEEDDDGDR